MVSIGCCLPMARPSEGIDKDAFKAARIEVDRLRGTQQLDDAAQKRFWTVGGTAPYRVSADLDQAALHDFAQAHQDALPRFAKWKWGFVSANLLAGAGLILGLKFFRKPSISPVYLALVGEVAGAGALISWLATDYKVGEYEWKVEIANRLLLEASGEPLRQDTGSLSASRTKRMLAEVTWEFNTIPTDQRANLTPNWDMMKATFSLELDAAHVSDAVVELDGSLPRFQRRQRWDIAAATAGLILFAGSIGLWREAMRTGRMPPLRRPLGLLLAATLMFGASGPMLNIMFSTRNRPKWIAQEVHVGCRILEHLGEPQPDLQHVTATGELVA